MQKPPLLTLRDIDAALSGYAAGFRCITELQPVGDKVFPPTYEGGEYATEGKRFKTVKHKVVGKRAGDAHTVEEDQFAGAGRILLDSVQSQANRMEQALLDAHRRGKVKFPLAVVNFA